MQRRMSLPIGTALLAVVWLSAAGFASADTWLQVDAAGVATVAQTATAHAPDVTATVADPRGLAGFQVLAETHGVLLQKIENKTGQFAQLSWPDASFYGDVGTPALPTIRRLFVVPEGATASLSYDLGNAVTVVAAATGMPARVLPVQPPVEKIPGAVQNAVFAFNDAAYAVDASTPAERVTIQELGLVRGQHLWLLEIHPVAHNPVAGTLTIWPNIAVNVAFAGGNTSQNGLSALPGLRRVILNPQVLPAGAQRGTGNYVIIVTSAYESAIATFANAKQAQGFTVTTHGVAAGTTKETIKSYIAGLYAVPATSPDYILLVGDTDTIPYWTGGGEGTPATDIQYVCMDGTSDWYPDIALGRFSVRSAAQLQAIVDKTLLFENGPLPDPEYVKRAVFMASEDNYTVSEGTHNWVIQNYMAPNEIVCDKLYCHTYGATPAQVSAAFNSGRFFGIYSGHGAETYWADGPVFYQSDVTALTNLGMYPFVCSFSCVTGTYTVDECFMETWQRAPSKGAIIAIGSSVTSYWTEDDVLERRLFDSIYDGNDAVVAEVGPVLNDAKMRYLAEMGNGATTRRYFEMYNILGDPALEFPGNCSDAGVVQLDRAKYACSDLVSIRVSDCGLNTNDNVIETVTVPIISDAEPTGESVLLTETSPNSATFVGTINISTTNATGVLWVAAGNTITVTYNDADNGQGTPVVVTATATVDCTPPVISNVHATNIQARTATIAFAANEPARGTVHYGLSCGSLGLIAGGSGYSTAPTVDLSGLQDNTTYYYTVEAEDEAGNATADPTCYSFTTPEIPDYFTQLFTTDNDLDNLSLIFVPNNSSDFYHACAQAIAALPTDPAGGTPLSLTDDSYALVTVSGGNTVTLYGVSYSQFYVGSNGYITFSSGDSTYTETLDAHFNQPRVSALFDDLDPAQGGTVSWKQLADRLAITWLAVPEHSGSNANTFQIELYFNGQITISYLAVAATDGLAGLSAGGGTSPDFYMSDLSALGSCQSYPPVAHTGTASTPQSTAVNITLAATDDGLPNPPGYMTYIVTSLPVHGQLSDPHGGALNAVPYTLLNGGKVARYTPHLQYVGTDTFQFKANDGGAVPDGGDSNLATITVTMTGVAQLAYSFPLDTDPGWTKSYPLWAFGKPNGLGSHAKDPSTGHTGNNVYGYNLSGDYANSMPARTLTTTAINCSNVVGVELRFWRWLGVEQYDHAAVSVSNNGTSWTTVWDSFGTTFNDAAWSQQTYSIAATADHQATVYIRWTMGPTDASNSYPGWNIDDVELWGLAPPVWSAGDLNCDGSVNFADINPFVLALSNPATYATAFVDCNIMNGDINGDGTVGFTDINPFVALLSGGK